MTKATNKGLQITVDPEIASKLAFVLKLQQTCGAAVQLENVEGLFWRVSPMVADVRARGSAEYWYSWDWSLMATNIRYTGLTMASKSTKDRISVLAIMR
ncbi:hypothetical protein [Serratia ureilytica]|uniref:hypothetical protein n=1 Tax=Serratia ureilytica TaxID=300181 RepID=UPI001E2FE5E7|nr:hypothetical protein [Serratia ureilytica]